MSIPATTIWLLILALGLGTYLIRLSFLGLIGRRPLPDWVLRHLRYAPFAVIPGLVLPMLVPGGGTPTEPLRLVVAGLVLVVGWRSKNTLAAIGLGALCYFGLRLTGIG